MTINYALYKNNLTEADDLYAARVMLTGSADLNTIVERIVDQGTTVTRTDIVAVLESAIEATDNLLLEGSRVNFGGLCDLYPRISGKFNGITDHYDPSRHKVDVGASPGSRVRKTVRDGAAVNKQNTILPKPLISQYSDLGSGEVNNHITPDSIGSINGSKLSFDESDPDEGIYFNHTTSPSKIKVTAVQKNKPSELVFMVPDLADGEYQLEVYKRFTENGELRSGHLDTVLTVAAAAVAAG
jgi:hypothetical protein